MSIKTEVAINTLGLGDVVSLFDDGYGTGTVSKITNDEVHVFRPYVHTADFSMSGGEPGASAVMCYIGTETVKLWKRDYRMVTLLSKSDPLR